MTTNDRTPVILALLADLVREHSLAAPDDADLLHLSDGLALAVDHCAAALMWALGDADEHNLVIDLGKIITGEMEAFVGPDKRRIEVAVARRLADVAASLLVRGDVRRAEAAALWDAASRLLGLVGEAKEVQDRQLVVDFYHVDRRRHALEDELDEARNKLSVALADGDRWGKRYMALAVNVCSVIKRPVPMLDDPGAVGDIVDAVKSMRMDLDSLTEQRDEAIRQRDEARRQVKAWQCEEDERRRERDEARSKAGHADIVAKLLARTYETVTVALGRPASATPHLLDPGAPGDIASAVRLVLTERDEARADLASMTEQRDEAIRQRDEARRERDGNAAVNTTVARPNKWPPGLGDDFEDKRGDSPAEPNPDNRDSYRSTVLRAGAKDCALFIGPGPRDLTFVVEMRNGCKVFDVVAALEREHGLAPESYRIREVRTPTTSAPYNGSANCVHGKPELECPECSVGYG